MKEILILNHWEQNCNSHEIRSLIIAYLNFLQLAAAFCRVDKCGLRVTDNLCCRYFHLIHKIWNLTIYKIYKVEITDYLFNKYLKKMILYSYLLNKCDIIREKTINDVICWKVWSKQGINSFALLSRLPCKIRKMHKDIVENTESSPRNLNNVR